MVCQNLLSFIVHKTIAGIYVNTISQKDDENTLFNSVVTEQFTENSQYSSKLTKVHKSSHNISWSQILTGFAKTTGFWPEMEPKSGTALLLSDK